MVSVAKNDFVNHTTYDTVNPDQTKFYSEKTTLDQSKYKDKKSKISKDSKDNEDNEDNEESETEDIGEQVEMSDSGCAISKKQLIGLLQPDFPPNTFEIYYKTHQSICSYEIMLNIMRDYNKKFERLSIHEFKKNLIDVFENNKDNISRIILLLIDLNKKVVLEKVLDKTITFNDIILTDEYYLTYIDMVLIAKYYNLPIVLISSMPILGNLSDDTLLIPNKIQTDKWYFIKLPSIVTRVKKLDFPIYKLLTYNKNLLIDINDVSESLRTNIKSNLANPRDLLTFLIENYKPKKKYVLKIQNPKPTKYKLKIVE